MRVQLVQSMPFDKQSKLDYFSRLFEHIQEDNNLELKSGHIPFLKKIASSKSATAEDSAPA